MNIFEKREECPMCKSVDAKLFYKAAAFGADGLGKSNNGKKVDVYSCNNCGFAYATEILNDKGWEFWGNYSSNVHERDENVIDKRQQMYQLEYTYIKQFLDAKKRNDILDVGCAEGKFLDFFSCENNCYGVEVGDEAITRAKEKYTIFQGELPALKIDMKFDLIIFRGVIQYLKKPDEYFDKAVSLLKSGGIVYITSTPRADAFAHKLFKEQFNLPICALACNGFTVGVLKEYFGKKDFVAIGEKFFYEETPYANIKNDIKIVNNAIEDEEKGNKISYTSPAFYGNMMTLVFKKA